MLGAHCKALRCWAFGKPGVLNAYLKLVLVKYGCGMVHPVCIISQLFAVRASAGNLTAAHFWPVEVPCAFHYEFCKAEAIQLMLFCNRESRE
eukprot:256512-Pelagomonas_calceolata.AAC.6